ncbi:MAG: FGGY-family carbohydrate kinase [Methanocella sp.]
MPYLLGVDVGTQSLRACLFDLAGRLVGEAVVGLETKQPAPGWVEQDPEDWLEALTAGVAKVVGESGVRPDEVAALSYACTSCTVVALDVEGRPIRPAIMWLDERARHQAERITATGDPVLKYGGGREGRESPQWLLPKAMWLAEHEPDVFSRAYRVVEQTDFLTYHLSGRWTVSRSSAAAKWHYVAHLGGYPHDLLARLGCSRLAEKWPAEVAAVGTRLGIVSPAFAAQTGLSPQTLVVQGGVDSHAGMVGVGALKPGDMALVIGTSSCHMAQAAEAVFADVWGPYDGAVEDGTFTLGGGQSTTGSIMGWLRDIFGGESLSHGELDRRAAALPPGSEGLVALDFFQGNRTPFKDPLAKGAIWGLTLRHTPAHLWRAFYEAVAYGTRAILDNLDQHGYRVDRLLAAGGGTRSPLWMQIHADVSGRSVQLTESEQPTALGAAIWAGLGAGVFRDYGEAVGRMVRQGRLFAPDQATREVYEFYYRQYLETYRCLQPLMAETAGFEENRGLEEKRERRGMRS